MFAFQRRHPERQHVILLAAASAGAPQITHLSALSPGIPQALPSFALLQSPRSFALMHSVNSSRLPPPVVDSEEAGHYDAERL